MEQKNKIEKKYLANYSSVKGHKYGFSLIEVLISTFIFSLAVFALVVGFNNFIKNYIQTKKTQRNIERLEQAMNLMAKTMRTSQFSGDLSGSMNNIDIFDYSQGKCVRYHYDSANQKIQIATTTETTAPTDISGCHFSTIGAYSDLTSNVASANVSVIATTSSTGYGRATISLKVEDESSIIPIQMTVSLRQ